jgi:hypothetical protein
MRKHRASLSAAAILAGAFVIAGITGAARQPAPATTGPAWLAGPGGHALEKVVGDIAATPHWTVTGGWDNYPWGNSIIYPALQVPAGGGYWAYGKTTNVGSAGSTPGFSYDVTPQANVVAYSTSATGLVSPTAPTLPGSGTSVGVSVSAS